MKAMNGVVRYGSVPETAYATLNDKFPQEKVCYEDDDFLIHFDGILLNGTQLKSSLQCSDNREILLQLYKTHGAELVFHAKGVYALVIWDKQAQKLLVTNDLLSKRPVYYCNTPAALYYAASYYDILDSLSRDGHKPDFHMDALSDMLRVGFLNGSKTYLKDVLFLNAFESLVVDLKEGATQIVHHKIKTVDLPDSEDELIDRFDSLFSEAMRLQLEKNAEYGYTQCATLSGGMDSRACVLLAEKLGYTQGMVCFNYAQSGSLDYSISQQIAADLGVDYLYYPMDAAVFLNRLDEAMDRNECMQSGIGATGARTMASVLNTSNLGLISIGICGGELMGDLISCERGNEPSNRLLRVTLRYARKAVSLLLPQLAQTERFEFDYHEYLTHLRASKNFASMFIDKCECVSPFMDEDVVMFVLQLDPALLCFRRFYRKWMIRHLPNEYITTITCATIYSNELQERWAQLKYKFLLQTSGVSKWNMNPIDHWFEFHPEHAENRTEEYSSNRRLLQEKGCPEEILEAMDDRWYSTWLPKLYVLTAQRAVLDLLRRFSEL